MQIRCSSAGSYNETDLCLIWSIISGLTGSNFRVFHIVVKQDQSDPSASQGDQASKVTNLSSTRITRNTSAWSKFFYQTIGSGLDIEDKGTTVQLTNNLIAYF